MLENSSKRFVLNVLKTTMLENSSKRFLLNEIDKKIVTLARMIL
jgi:hypothetical protein